MSLTLSIYYISIYDSWSIANKKKVWNMKKKLTKRQLQAMETRQKIYDTAKTLFSKFGYDAVSIDDIIREAGVARGSFYVYFMSKEDLSVYLMMDELKGYQHIVREYWEKLDRTLPARELIIQTACGICSMVRDWGVATMRTVYKIFIERASTTGTAVKSLFEMPDLFTALYELGVSRGEFKPVESSVIAENIKTLLIGITYEWCLYHPDYDFIGRVTSLLNDYLSGFSKS